MSILTDDEIRNLPAGPEMNALIATEVMGWHMITDEYGRKHWEDAVGFTAGMNWNDDFEDDEDFHILHWHPSESILWAWEVMEKLNKIGLHVDVHENVPYRGHDENLSECLLTYYWNEEEEPMIFQAIGDTAPLAICRAALLWAIYNERLKSRIGE
jgi:hypothetical protein